MIRNNESQITNLSPSNKQVSIQVWLCVDIWSDFKMCMLHSWKTKNITIKTVKVVGQRDLFYLFFIRTSALELLDLPWYSLSHLNLFICCHK